MASTIASPPSPLHRIMFFAVFSASHHVFPMLSSSFVNIRLHDCFGLPCRLPFILFPIMAILVVFSLSFLKVCPIRFHFLRSITIATRASFSSSFMTTSGQKIPRIWRSLLFTDVCTLENRTFFCPTAFSFSRVNVFFSTGI